MEGEISDIEKKLRRIMVVEGGSLFVTCFLQDKKLKK